jgi:hypothetical protein
MQAGHKMNGLLFVHIFYGLTDCSLRHRTVDRSFMALSAMVTSDIVIDPREAKNYNKNRETNGWIGEL